MHLYIYIYKDNKYIFFMSILEAFCLSIVIFNSNKYLHFFKTLKTRGSQRGMVRHLKMHATLKIM